MHACARVRGRHTRPHSTHTTHTCASAVGETHTYTPNSLYTCRRRLVFFLCFRRAQDLNVEHSALRSCLCSLSIPATVGPTPTRGMDAVAHVLPQVPGSLVSGILVCCYVPGILVGTRPARSCWVEKRSSGEVQGIQSPPQGQVGRPVAGAHCEWPLAADALLMRLPDVAAAVWWFGFTISSGLEF